MAGKVKQKAAVDTVVGEVVLRFLEGENEGVEIRVTPPRQLTMGRSEECDIFLGEKKISRKHCLLIVSSDAVLLRDLQSTNGTFLNAKKVNESAVESDDKIRVGTSVIQVSIHAEKAITSSIEPEVEALQPPKELVVPAAEFLSEAAKGAEHESSGIFSVEEEESQAEEAFEEPPEFLAPEPEEEPKIKEKSKGKLKPLTGNLSAMGLADLLQNLAQNKKSGLLRLTADRVGKIWIVEGQIMNAEVGPVHGSKGIYRMLGWNEGEFELLALPGDFDPKKVKQPISESMESLLMEGFRQFDELEKLKKGLPALSAVLAIKPKFSASLSKLHPRVLDVLQVVINEGTFQNVLDQSPFTDLETSKIVFYLLKKEYIVAA